jgi:hypothetical protein
MPFEDRHTAFAHQVLKNGGKAVLAPFPTIAGNFLALSAGLDILRGIAAQRLRLLMLTTTAMRWRLMNGHEIVKARPARVLERRGQGAKLPSRPLPLSGAAMPPN